MSKEIAAPIPLKVWQDPQCDVVLHAGRDGCAVYFGCWAIAGEPADYICKLTFTHGWAVRGYNSEFLPYERGGCSRSCIYEIENSEWLRQETTQREKNYPEWKEWDKKSYHHYVVSGHDNYYEIIAASFDEQIILRADAGEMARLIDEA